ncbi:MAG: inositol monophosphatase family protein [Acetobacter sp.]|jgi:histidinol phosphatase-like enzyme (inositol monophosphatase family)
MKQTDLDIYLKTALILADVAGSVIRPLFRSGATVGDKSDASPVTIADRGAERVMRALLEELHPDHGVLGEEFGHHNNGSPFCWALDPVDGTRSFITGRPLFGTLISLMHNGIPVIGIIDQPISGERWIGVAGRQTLFRSGNRDSITAPAETCLKQTLDQAELSCTSPEMLEAAPSGFYWSSLKNACRRITWGGDCYAYGLLALGQIDIIAECDMNVWDWAALVPVIEGAGGKITDWAGDPLRADGDRTVLATGNASLLSQSVKYLRNPST